MTQRPPVPPPPPPRSQSVPPMRGGSNDEITQQNAPATTRLKPPSAAAAAQTTRISAANSGQRSRAAIVPPPRPQPRRYAPSPGQPRLETLVQEAYNEGFSDVHLGVGEVPRFRNRGEIDPADYPETDYPTFMSWLYEILKEDEVNRFQEELEFDGATQYEFARVRINIFDSLKGPAMVLRLIPLRILTMEQLRLPEIFKDVCHYHKGLILVTGPTGSGKSTTMAAMVDYINTNMPKHIISIEDPIEFVHRSQRSLIKQREVGIHTRQFDRALKAALREDPDIILIGEMRDRETVNTALKASQTGHVVMGTLHTNSAVKTMERILSLYAPEEQDAMRTALAESLIAIIAQGLCRTTDGKRAAFHDILINTETIKDYIKDSKYEEILEIMREGEFDGMITMNQSLFNLYQDGRITEETALELAPSPNEMAQMLRGRF